MQKLERMLGYDKATTGRPEWRIKIRPRNLQVTAFSDASYAQYGWDERRKSQLGFVLAIGGALMLSKSQKTKVTCDSVTGAEIISLHEALRELLWARLFLDNLGFKQHASPIYEDNKACVDLSTRTSGFNGQTRHLEIRYFKVKDAIEDNLVSVHHVPSTMMLADHLTKPLDAKTFLDQALRVCDSNIFFHKRQFPVYHLRAQSRWTPGTCKTYRNNA